MVKGFTTPDMDEARVKTAVMKNSYMAYVLSDSTKFGNVSSVTFAKIKSACVITDSIPDQAYSKLTVIKEVKE